MRFLVVVFFFLVKWAFGQPASFEANDQNGTKRNYYHIDRSLKKSLEEPITKTKDIIKDISRERIGKVCAQFPPSLMSNISDTLMEDRIKWASKLISKNISGHSELYFEIGPEVYFGQQNQKGRLVTFVYDLPTPQNERNYMNRIRVTFIEVADSFDWEFNGQFKILALGFDRASDQIEIDRMKNLFK